jgi:cytochrome P450
MTAPTITYDIYSDESLSNPYPIYEELRSLGSAVWMEPHNAFVLPRYTACRDALRNWRVFASGNGVMMNDPMNAAASNQLMLCTDGERHSKLRSVVGAPLMTKALDNVRPLIETEATALVDRLVAQGTFDAVSEFAQHLPVTIVSVDQAAHVVTFYGADKRVRKLEVQTPEAKAFIKKLKANDEVIVSYTEALAVSVELVELEVILTVEDS